MPSIPRKHVRLPPGSGTRTGAARSIGGPKSASGRRRLSAGPIPPIGPVIAGPTTSASTIKSGGVPTPPRPVSRADGPGGWRSPPGLPLPGRPRHVLRTVGGLTADTLVATMGRATQVIVLSNERDQQLKRTFEVVKAYGLTPVRIRAGQKAPTSDWDPRRVISETATGGGGAPPPVGDRLRRSKVIQSVH